MAERCGHRFDFTKTNAHFRPQCRLSKGHDCAHEVLVTDYGSGLLNADTIRSRGEDHIGMLRMSLGIPLVSAVKEVVGPSVTGDVNLVEVAMNIRAHIWPEVQAFMLRNGWDGPLADLSEKEMEAVDKQMADHMYGHSISNSPNSFGCDPHCRTQALGEAFRRHVLVPRREILDE